MNRLYSYYNGRKLLTKEGREKKQEILEELLLTWKEEPTSDPIPLIELEFFFKDKRKRDVDGPIKFTLDALSGFVYKDDSLIQSIKATKYVDPQNPRMEITVHYEDSKNEKQ